MRLRKQSEKDKPMKKKKIIFYSAWSALCLACWMPFFRDRLSESSETAADEVAVLQQKLGNVSPVQQSIEAVIEEIINKNIDVVNVEVDTVTAPDPEKEPEPTYIEVGSTAYCDPVDKPLASGEYPRAGHTLAGKREWMGLEADLYDSEMNYMGTYRFEDVGYGRSTGYGDSELFPGRNLGDIETGDTIDIWFGTEMECLEYGRKRVYMVWK